jgi:hypothetical protein
MGRHFSFIGPMLGLALVGLAVSSRVIEHGPGRATAFLLAGGIFTIALAVYIRD